MGKETEYEEFSGKDLITDGHWDRIARGSNSNTAGKKNALSDIGKKLKKATEELEYNADSNKLHEEAKNMLYIAHPNMAGKTKVVGTTVFIFDQM